MGQLEKLVQQVNSGDMPAGSGIGEALEAPTDDIVHVVLF